MLARTRIYRLRDDAYGLGRSSRAVSNVTETAADYAALRNYLDRKPQPQALPPELVAWNKRIDEQKAAKRRAKGK